MERLIEDYYVILSLLLACADLLICIGAFRRKGALGRYVGIISVFAIIVDISYMFEHILCRHRLDFHILC